MNDIYENNSKIFILHICWRLFEHTIGLLSNFVGLPIFGGSGFLKICTANYTLKQYTTL